VVGTVGMGMLAVIGKPAVKSAAMVLMAYELILLVHFVCINPSERRKLTQMEERLLSWLQ